MLKMSESIDSNVSNSQNKRKRSLNECLTTKTEEKNRLDKQTLINLISIKDKSLSFKPIESKQEYFKAFSRVLFDGKDTDFLKCNKCIGINLIKYTLKTGSSSVRRHNCINESQNSQTIDKHLIKVNKIDVKTKYELSDKIVMCVAKDLRPINMISGAGFKLMAQEFIKIGSRFPNISITEVLPSTTTVSNHLKTVYLKLKENVKIILSKSNDFGITCDHWNHDSTKINFMCTTVQYLEENHIKCRVLATKSVVNKTSEVTRIGVKEVLAKFGLTEKNHFYVTDNASAMISAFDSDQWFGCSAHNINLVHKHTFDDCKNYETLRSILKLIDCAKGLVKHFKHSGLQNKLPTTLKQSIEIRWDSTLEMLQSIKENYDQIKILSVNNHKIMELIIGINENSLNELINLLMPFYELRLNLCKDSEPTFHLVLPTKQKMILICEHKEMDSLFMKDLKTIYKKNINLYIKVKPLHFVAAILYPPIKNLNNLATNEEKTNALKLLEKIISEIPVNSTQDLTNYQINQLDLCIDGFTDIQQIPVLGHIQEEIQDYLNQNFCFFSKSIIEFWNESRNRFPRLSILSNRLSVIPATNLSSERNFSYSGLTLTDQRSSLDSENVNKLLFIRSNFDLIDIL